MITVDNVHVSYGETRALTGASTQIGQGKVTGLVGMNGAGKSTLFNAIMGNVPLTSGNITVDNLAPTEARKNGLISYVPQAESVDWTFPVSVRDVVTMGRYGHMNILRRPSKADKQAVQEALERANLTDLADRQIGQLSGGQRKRVFVARGIAQNAHVMLLDEPFAGVDKPSEATLTALLRELAAEGRTLLVSTHDLGSLPQLSDEVVLLYRTVIAQGAPAEVLTNANLSRAFGLDTSTVPHLAQPELGAGEAGLELGDSSERKKSAQHTRKEGDQE